MKIRTYLLMMVAGIIVPIIIFLAIALTTLLNAEREAALSSLHETARAAALLVDSELTSAEAALRVLAQSPHLASGDMPRFYEHAKTADRGEGGRTILFAPNGQQIINTVVPLGTSLPPPPVYVQERTLRVIETQKTIVSGLIQGAVQKKPVTTINIPVPLDDGRRYVLGAVFDTLYFTKILNGLQLPEAWTLTVLDRDGRIIARTKDADKHIGELANLHLIRLAGMQSSGRLRKENRNGVDAYYAFTRSPMSDWTIAVSTPASEIESAAQKAIVVTVLGMLVALICATAAAIVFGRRLVRSIGGAATAATALGHGAMAKPEHAGIAEVDALYRSLHNAGSRLTQAETERTQLLQSEQAARQTAEQENKLKDEFLAMLGHELRNPLSGIVGAASILESSGASAEMKKRATAILTRQSRHLTHIVDDLLDLARVSTGKVELTLQPVELAATVRASVEALQVAGKVDHQINIDAEPVWVNADRTRLEQIVNNLLTNALKYTPAGGRIDIQVRAQADQSLFVVRDTGIGISAELMPKLFDVFVQGAVTLDRAKGGLGIGLALVRNLVALHGGSVDADSPGNGQGSTFTVRLPRSSAAKIAAVAGNDATTQTDSPCHILIIEDNDDARHMLSANLEAKGCRVVEASTGVQGLQLAQAHKPDLAIVDIGLPGMDGYEIARRLRSNANTSGIKLIALTGYGSAEDGRRALAAGFDLHLVKPLDVDVLHDCLKQLFLHA